MPIAENFSSVYSHEWDINFTMCAPNGYLNYVNLCNLLQLTAAEHSITGGLSFNDMQTFDQAWVLSRIRVEIDRLPKWQDKVTIKTWIENLHGANSVRNMEMYCNGEKMVGATTYWAVLNTKLRKAEPLALDHGHFEKFPEWHATEKPSARINFLRDTQIAAERKVALSDLDIVNHANNVKYLEWCLDTMDLKPIMNKELKSLDMNFMRELNWGDDVSVNVVPADRPEFFSIAKEGKVCFALEMSWR
ncbi:acyl-[acyl-carrier-protein] thioesterase [Flavobacterium caeni]|uniref:Acyl-ACP thioesterase n=1 Tax=Flavobacterium caeni TaxID=490189 RepID=A0A1G5BGB3_9FLAO|nr:acyl-ACP thioesterase domain-containing protein [Flavobacterium caeni]SCX89213.1 Acyl-ACP thioesterase [Flavobacterium caeni]